MVARVADAKAPPDQMSDALGGPDGRVETVGEWPFFK